MSMKPMEAVPEPEDEKNAGELDFWGTLQKVNKPAEAEQIAGAGSGQPEKSTQTETPGKEGVQTTDRPIALQAKGESDKGKSGSSSGSGTGMSGNLSGSATGGDSAGITGGPGAGNFPANQPHSVNMRKRGESFPGSHAASGRPTGRPRPKRGGAWEFGDNSGEEEYIGVDVTSIEPGHSLWKFSEEEHDLLQQMVRDYEASDNSNDIIEVLLILLKIEDEPQIVIAIMGFLKEELRISLVNRNFKLAHNLLVNINLLRTQPGLVKDWSLPLLEKFSEDIAGPEVLNALAPLWALLPTLKPDTLKSFASFLRLLLPKAGLALVGMSAQVEFGKGRQILIDLIAAFAARDLDVLEQMLSQPEEDIILRLIGVIRKAPDWGRAEQLLFKIIKHPKEDIRKEVCDVLLERESEDFYELFPLIHDPNPLIGLRIFNYLGHERNPTVERMLMAYMTSAQFLDQKHDHISRCYLALGSCGSDFSLSFLGKVLFNQPWNFMVGLGQLVHRQGAALALYKIHTSASLKLLGEAESSSIPHIRKAWMKATGN